MHTLNFFPIGNADCTRIDLHNGQKILWDYDSRHDPSSKRIDLAKTLKEDLDKSKRDYFDVVAFTHADKDHYSGFSEFFHLDHAKKYQGNGRIRINELWVPAAVILETNLEDEALLLRTEARYRLKEGKGIRVFSKPNALKAWLASVGIALEDRQHLITSAGTTVSGFTKEEHGIEFFVHAPFSESIEDGKTIDRNNSALVVQATFSFNQCERKLILGSDLDSDVWVDIVNVSRHYNRCHRLEWDIFHISHHCSYKALNKDEKGTHKTDPIEELDWLFRNQGSNYSKIISPSDPIPRVDTKQPPHRQAAKYYKNVKVLHEGEFIVTMEHPSKSAPDVLVITLDCSGAKVKKSPLGAAAYITSRPSPRFG